MQTRRQFGKLALAALPAAALPHSLSAASWMRQKPNSKWAGVQVGMNVPYNFGTQTAGRRILEGILSSA